MDFALPSLYSISNPIPAIEAVLLLCLWPLPINTMYKDPSHALAGAAMQLAVQNGLHIFGHEQDFIRTRVCSPDSGKVFRAQLWMHCVTVFQRSDTPRTNPEDILKVAIAQAYAMVFLSGQSQDHVALIEIGQRRVYCPKCCCIVISSMKFRQLL
jgi:hypothetical protein